MKTYISDHWHGRHSMNRSLGLNTVCFNVAMVLLFSHLTNWLEVKLAVSNNTLLVLLVGFWLSVLCWQGVGAFRAASLRIQNFGSVTNYYAAFAVMLGCTIFTLASVATQYGEKIDYVQRGVDEYQPPRASFELNLTASKHIMLTGEIGYGATEQLNTLLNQNPKSSILILNSEGGLIVESRGLANTIKQRGLNTHVKQRCYSACTLAFIAGNERSMEKEALLGFHQYNLKSDTSMPWIEPLKEQQKDLRYFQEKNVADWFMEQAYSTPHNSIWTPSPHTLLSAGVITKKAGTHGL